jgi:hypothetical protein
MKRNYLSTIVVFANLLLLVPQIAAAQSEGIKVHGRWTIDVREADGALVQHHEFENALTGNGQWVLASWLSRSRVIGRWEVQFVKPLFNNGFVSPCGPFACTMAEPSLVMSGVSLNSSNTAINAIQLVGSVTATQDGTIGDVRTMVGACIDDPMCSNAEFTIKLLPTPIVVASGQIVQVKVILSFQ